MKGLIFDIGKNGNKLMITYEMLQGTDKQLDIRFEPVTYAPPTGDESDLALWCLLAELSLAGVCLVRKKTKSETRG